MKKISIMIVDDHNMIREAISSLLNQQENFEVLGQTGNPETVIELVTQNRPDIVLLDINMQPVSGFDMIKIIKKHSPLSKIIGLSMHNQPAYVKKMFRLGAKGYVSKNSRACEMIKAVTEVYNGANFICSESKRNLAEYILDDNAVDVNINKLSEREMQVIKYLKEGQTSKEIATELQISSRTVDVHRYRILKKFKLNNTISLLNFLTTNVAFDF